MTNGHFKPSRRGPNPEYNSVTTEQINSKGVPYNPGLFDGTTFKKENGDFVAYARGEHLYTGSKGDRAIMEVQNALTNIGSATRTSDYSNFSSKEGGIHYVGPGVYTIEDPLIVRSSCPIIGHGQPGGSSNAHTTFKSDGTVSKVVSLRQYSNSPWGDRTGAEEDTILEGVRVRGTNVDDTADLVVDPKGGQDNIVRRLELEATKGTGLKLSGTNGIVVEDVRLDNVGDATEVTSAVILKANGRVDGLRFKNSQTNPPSYLIDIGDGMHAKDIEITSSAGAGTACVRFQSHATGQGVQIQTNSGVPEGVRVQGNCVVSGINVDTSDVDDGIHVLGQAVVVGPVVKNVGQHGIVQDDETVVIAPYVENPSQDSSNSYDCVRMGSRGGGRLFSPFVDGGGSARHALFLDSRSSVHFPHSLKNVNGDLIHLDSGAGADNAIWTKGILEDGTVITANDISDNKDRTRWNGIIGGGPLGGVDVSGVTGQFDGDRAVDDGTNVVGALVECIWDNSASAWIPQDGEVDIASGTVSVSSGGTATVSTGAALDQNLNVHYSLDTDPDADAKVEYRLFWDDSATEWEVEFDETAANTGVTVRYQVTERGATI